MSQLRIYSLAFPKNKIKFVTNQLLYSSQWFAVTPLPEDLYAVDVKEENAERLNELKRWTKGELMSINMEQKLFVIPRIANADVEGYSCLGFENAQKERDAVRAWLGQPPVDPPEDLTNRGDLRKLWKSHQQAMHDGRTKNSRTKERCEFHLTPRFIGLEGKRVKVTHSDGAQETYRIERSTGWMPIHLAIEKNEDGGPAVYLPEDSTFEVLK